MGRRSGDSALAASRSTGTAQRPISSFEKFQLLRGLLSAEKAYTGPFYVVLDATRRCNLRCVGCPYHALTADTARPSATAEADISPDLIEALCGELSAMGTREIIFTGEGEPTGRSGDGRSRGKGWPRCAKPAIAAFAASSRITSGFTGCFDGLRP